MSDEQNKSQPFNGEAVPFKAEIRQLLDILIHSIYTERDIFLRELISNASDALNRVRFEMLIDRKILDPEVELSIRISPDSENKTLTISDTGIGMSKDELINNLGMIAYSGARAFIDEAKSDKSNSDNAVNLSDIIGQFGVGFYSVFMVAEWVRVTSHSFKPDIDAATWYATGSETYHVSRAEQTTRGTTIEIKLKDDSLEFLQEYRLREVIQKYSSYIGFPIYLGDSQEPVNKQIALWRKNPRDVSEDQYDEFYRQISFRPESPLLKTHLVTDAPVQVYALLFIPSNPEKKLFLSHREDGLKLYVRKILIQEYCKDLLPEYLRFVEGVVDSEDLPLNISRETYKSNALLGRLKKVLTGRVISDIKELSIKDPELYGRFWNEFGQFMKEGIATTLETTDREILYPVLRFHTTKFPDQWNSLDNYVGRMKSEQKAIYYILGNDQLSIVRSPHLDYFTQHSFEVITLTDPVDSFMVMGLTSYEGFSLQNVAVQNLDLPDGSKDNDLQKSTNEQYEPLLTRIKVLLGEKIADVRLTDRLSDSVARLADPDGTLNPELQRVYRLIGKDYEVPKKVLEINSHHEIIILLKDHLSKEEVVNIMIKQIYENALLIDGLHPDPAAMIPQIQEMIKASLNRL